MRAKPEKKEDDRFSGAFRLEIDVPDFVDLEDVYQNSLQGTIYSGLKFEAGSLSFDDLNRRINVADKVGDYLRAFLKRA